MLILIVLGLDLLLCLCVQVPLPLTLASLFSLPWLAVLDWRMLEGHPRARPVRTFYLGLWFYLVWALLPWPQTACPEPRVFVDKRRRELRFQGKAMPIALSHHWSGSKQIAGDGRTPEGRYRICSKAPDGPFGYWLGLDYPNREDAWQGRMAGRIS